MPKYVKFMKEILKNKRKLEDHETAILNEECSAILLNKLPPKVKDSESFTIPYTIGNFYFEKALYDLGASINLIPLFVFRILGLEKSKPSSVSLQLADRSTKYPRGVIEDVLVNVKNSTSLQTLSHSIWSRVGKYLSFWDVHFLQLVIH